MSPPKQLMKNSRSKIFLKVIGKICGRVPFLKKAHLLIFSMELIFKFFLMTAFLRNIFLTPALILLIVCSRLDFLYNARFWCIDKKLYTKQLFQKSLILCVSQKFQKPRLCKKSSKRPNRLKLFDFFECILIPFHQ